MFDDERRNRVAKMDAMIGHADGLSRRGWPEHPLGPVDARRAWLHPVSYGAKAVSSEAAARIAQLTEGQRDCLRAVYAHMTSKDIARALGISPHTVDMRLRTAMKTLGVASRIEAARLLADSEDGTEAYQPLIYQASEVVADGDVGTLGAPASTTSDEYATQHSDPRFSPGFDPSAGGPPRPAGASLPFGDDMRIAGGRQDERSDGAPLVVSLPWGHRNTLSPGARLGWIAMIAIGSALGFGAILGALEALTKLL
jgi:DNA-binding CsgD family transcriptional regulator